jgi:hypothetical protein
MSRGKKAMQPFWRPNFVNQSALPDIKVVRTDFTINVVALMLALGVVFFLLQREYRTYSLGNTIASMELRILMLDPDNVKNLKLSESFRESAQYIVEVEKFNNFTLLAHQFLYDLSVIKPEDLIYRTVSLSEAVEKQGTQSTVIYNINITGDAKDLIVVGEFKEVLEAAELFQIANFDFEVNETLEGRDEKTGIFP